MSKYQEQIETNVATIEKTVSTKNLIVHNDEVNTFDWVIQALVDVCNHSHEQAEQCSILIDSKGKYAVKEGSLAKLRPLKNAITDRGISATIE